jgi:hypothetical protein
MTYTPPEGFTLDRGKGRLDIPPFFKYSLFVHY